MQYVLVTGVSSGIGYEITRFLIEKGYYVLGSVRKQADAERLRKAFPQQFHALIFDVCDQSAIDLAVVEVEKKLQGSGLTCLVNNAGYVVNGPLQHLPIEQLQQQFEVNVYGVLRVIQAFLPLLGAQIPAKYPPGKIINISSVSGFVTAPFLGAYAMSKYALESMSDALRRELCIYDIDVIILEPGAIQSEIWNKAKHLDPLFLKTDYGPILKNWNKMVENSERNVLAPIEIARTIHTVIKKKRPATRHIIAKNKFVMKLVKYVFSDRFIDKQLSKSFKKKVGKS